MGFFLGGIFAEGRKRFTDTFDRSNTTTGLGTSSDGSAWSALRGTMKVSSNAATSLDAASTYPAATVTMPSKASNTITLNGTANGSGSILWATDSGNWWATDVYQYTYSATSYYSYATGNYYCGYGQCTTCPSGYVAVYATGYAVTPVYSYAGPFCGNWNSSNIHNAQYCTSYYYNYYISNYSLQPYQYATGNYTCSGTLYTSCCSPGATADYASGSTTTTYYPKYVRVLQSVANTVTQVASQLIGDSATISSLKTLVTGNQITVKAFSDTNAVTQVGSDLVYTATGATVTPQFGIVITPQGYNQGSTINSITIE